MDFAARRSANVYKPLIDDALARIAGATGGDKAAIGTALASVPAVDSQWTYLVAALDAIRDRLVTDGLEAKLENDWFVTIAKEPRQDDLPFVESEYYPEESHAFLEEEDYVAGEDADVVGLWTRRGGHQSLCHAHMEGFWILGRDVAEFVEWTAATAEGKDVSDAKREAEAAARVEAQAE